MRFYLIIILTMIQTAAFSQNDQPDEAFTKVTYHAGTRGRQITITASQDSIHYILNDGAEKEEVRKPLADSLVLQLTQLISQLDLEALDDLKAPTQERHRDADWYASISITTAKDTYSTSDFNKTCPISEVKHVIDFFEGVLNIKLYSKEAKGCQ